MDLLPVPRLASLDDAAHYFEVKTYYQLLNNPAWAQHHVPHAMQAAWLMPKEWGYPQEMFVFLEDGPVERVNTRITAVKIFRPRANVVAAWAVDFEPFSGSERHVHPISEYSGSAHVYEVLPDVLDYIYSPARRGTFVASIHASFKYRDCNIIRFSHDLTVALPPWTWRFEGGRTVDVDGGYEYRQAMRRLREGYGV